MAGRGKRQWNWRQRGWVVLLFLLFQMVALPGWALAPDLKRVAVMLKGPDRGVERYFLVHTPPGYTAAPKTSSKRWPVVLVLHGGGGSPEGMASSTGMNKTADKYGFIAVYPAGTSRKADNRFLTWNAGLCCGTAAQDQVDDVGFLAVVMSMVEETYYGDPQRIYATGMSNGAQMSHRLACELSTRIAAVAPVAGQPMMSQPCKPARAVPILHFHGTADMCAKFDGGTDCGGCFTDFFQGLGIPMKRQVWPCEAVPKSIGSIASTRGCSAAHTPYFKKGNVDCEQFSACSEKAPVILCTIKGGGHTWPGDASSGNKFCSANPSGFMCKKWQAIVGPVNQDVSANELMWQFFSRHHL